MQSRKAARAHLATLISATGAFQAVYESEHKALSGQSPVAMIHSAGSDRERILDGTYTEVLRFEIGVYVVRSGDTAAGEDAVENALDDLDATIAGVIDANIVSAGKWNDLRQSEASVTAYVTIDGVQYRAEMIPVEVTVFP